MLTNKPEWPLPWSRWRRPWKKRRVWGLSPTLLCSVHCHNCLADRGRSFVIRKPCMDDSDLLPEAHPLIPSGSNLRPLNRLLCKHSFFYVRKLAAGKCTFFLDVIKMLSPTPPQTPRTQSWWMTSFLYSRLAPASRMMQISNGVFPHSDWSLLPPWRTHFKWEKEWIEKNMGKFKFNFA